ncbi:fimbrial protein [Scandinavium sp. V105_16]|uniref:Fimbrial protein n=1 Tax=Scandinavium lactucae TaxID=3095028 RepID=A0AAJ2S899_9ENTR|nr:MULTISPECIES: fimbrial protein [unclassified Scandinavium]MDX6021503.1 fimbrial protein [Scandinavium sp. V105_16]MDX6031668.1 fimbrial protein [Scandinavium sp. V105_12]
MKNFIGILKRIGSAKNSLRSLLAVLLLACGAQNAMALGVCDVPSTIPQVTINQDFSVLKSQPVGTILATYSYNQQYLLANNCSGDYIKYAMTYNGLFPRLDSSTTASGVPGVGIRVTIDNSPVLDHHVLQTFTGDGTTPIYVQTVKVDFVKTGETAPGTMTTGQLATVQIEDSVNTSPRLKINIGNVVVTQRSCEITGSSAIPVPMGEAKKEDFTGKDSTLTPVNVEIPLQCFADTSVNISFDATSTLGNGIIDLAKGGAEGVGIQLKLSGKTVEFDKKTFVTKTTAEGAFNIPLTAAYIQTADIIKPGPANAVANFTVTYE